MKRVLFSLFILSIIFTACPPLLEDDVIFEEATMTYDGILDYQKWLDILEEVGRQRKYVRLDLKDCTYIEDNEGGGLVKVKLREHDTNGDPIFQSSDPTYIAFDPMPNVGWGKDYIVSIVLPDMAEMINQATPNRVGNEKEADKKKSAFAKFTNLRSVSAANLKIIGNYAFVDITTLKEIDFPNVGHAVTPGELADSDNLLANGFRVDIGHYAFKGCTSLTSAIFNSAAVIGRHAFEGCTSLEEISFPKVWMIGENAFTGCEKLTEVRFEDATKIGNESFKDCTGIEKAFFPADPIKSTPGNPTGVPVYDSVIFYPGAFSGCTALKTLDIRNAWYVYFSTDALENIGTTLELYLAGIYGHPQAEPFLGDAGNSTLSNMEIIVTSGTTTDIETDIAQYIRDTYSILVSVTQ